MSKGRFVCPHCGKPDWSRAPRLAAVLGVVKRRKEATSRDVANALGISIQNASNLLVKLEAYGFVKLARTEPHPSGGVESIFAVGEAES